MATNDLIIDDSYVISMGRYFRMMGGKIDTMIDDYISKLQEIKDSAIMDGEIAKSLTIYIVSAQALKCKAGDMGLEMKSLVSSFIKDVDDADQFLF